MFTSYIHVFLLSVLLPFVHATIYVTAPLSSTTCHAGQDCLVQWLENGEAPFLPTIGPCYVGLYNGNGVLVQQIQPVNVADVHSLEFKPDPSAGPDSSDYYVNFTSVNPIGNPPSHYIQYSPFFTLTGMSGSFASPVSSDTSSLPVPSSVASPSPSSILSTFSVSNSFPSSSASSSPTSSLISASPSATPSRSVSVSSAILGSVSASSSRPSSSSGSSSPSISSTLSSSSSALSSASSITRSTSPGGQSSSFVTSRLPSSPIPTPSPLVTSPPSPSASSSSAARTVSAHISATVFTFVTAALIVGALL